MDFRVDWFIETIEYQADWRRHKAAEYPEDDRNLHTAEALDGLAAWLKRLPDNEPILVRLGAALQHLDAFSFAPSLEDRLARFRFNSDETRRDFITHMTGEIEEELDVE
jgi:hypothetical protein